jgi:uncharacterized membrane protein (UPF0127 family)
MAWLVCEARVLASLEIAESRGSRLKGLLGRSGIDGAILLAPARSIHTLGMRFPIDVAFCDADLTVLAIRRVRPHRIPLSPRGTRAVVEAENGSFERWELRPGDQLEIRR